MTVAAPLPSLIAETMPELRISRASTWSDSVWQFDVTLPGTVRSDVRLDWSFALSDGSRFTDAQWTSWCEAAKRFLWSLRVAPPTGHRRVRDSTLVRRFINLRVLIQWMASEGYYRFADLDPDAAERFLTTVQARPGRKGKTLDETTLSRYAWILNMLYMQRDRLSDTPAEDLLVSERFHHLTGRLRQRQDALPSTPDAIVVPLVCSAIRLIGSPADDVITLRDHAQAALDDAMERKLDRRAAKACAREALADFRFSTPPGEASPWRTEPVSDITTVQFLVTRLYDACFVVIAYLVGARVSEILGLKADCIESQSSADGMETFSYLIGRIYKTADSPGGHPHRWVAPAPVVRAVAVLERLSEPVRRRSGRDDLWLKPTALRDTGIPRSSTYVQRLNGPFATFIDLPHHNGQPWHLSPHQGRKTFARFVGRRDRTGLHALAAHFGHVARVMTDAGYVGTDFELNDLIDTEALEETRAALEELLTAVHAGGKAGHMIAARSRFRGRTRAGDVSEYVDCPN